jgi:hypothetical protein
LSIVDKQNIAKGKMTQEELSIRDVALDKDHPHKVPAQLALLDNVATYLQGAKMLEALMTEAGHSFVPDREFSDENLQMQRIRKRLEASLVMKSPDSSSKK